MPFSGLFAPEPPPLIQQALEDLRQMLETTEGMFTAATDCLLEGSPPPEDLRVQDARVNEKEQAVRRAILTHFSVNPGRELAFGLILASVVQEVERMGDLTKSLAKTAALAHARPAPERLAPLHDLRERILGMSRETRLGFVEGDAERTRRVMAHNDEIKAITTRYLSELAEAEGLSANEGIVLALSVRQMGRFAAHLSNVASAVALPYDQFRQSL